MLYNTFIIINNNWKRAMESTDKKQNNVVVDEQMAQNLQQVNDVAEQSKGPENDTPINGKQKISANDQLGVNVEGENKPEEYQTIRIMGRGKAIDSNIVKVGAVQGAVMTANALVGFSNPIGLMICIAIAFKKFTASTKNIEFEQDAGKIKKISGVPDQVFVEIDSEGSIKGEDPAEFLSDENNPKKMCCKVNKKILDEIAKVFNEEEQKRCAETNKIEINEDKAKKLSKILNCNVKAGMLDFDDEKSLNDVLEARTVKNIEFMKALTSILNPKISESTKQISILSEKMNENIQPTQIQSKNIVAGKGQGRGQ